MIQSDHSRTLERLVLERRKDIIEAIVGIQWPFGPKS